MTQTPTSDRAARTAVAVRHLAFEDLGLIEPVLRALGYTVRYLDIGIDEVDGTAESPDPIGAADLVVVLGGPIGANDGDRYPVISTLIHTP